jgi:hypothetical protein
MQVTPGLECRIDGPRFWKSRKPSVLVNSAHRTSTAREGTISLFSRNDVQTQPLAKTALGDGDGRDVRVAAPQATAKAIGEHDRSYVLLPASFSAEGRQHTGILFDSQRRTDGGAPGSLIP